MIIILVGLCFNVLLAIFSLVTWFLGGGRRALGCRGGLFILFLFFFLLLRWWVQVGLLVSEDCIVGGQTDQAAAVLKDVSPDALMEVQLCKDGGFEESEVEVLEQIQSPGSRNGDEEAKAYSG